MALKKSYSINKVYSAADGDVINKTFTYPAAYFKIERLQGNKNEIEFVVDVFIDETKSNKVNAYGYTFTPSMNNQNFIAQGYDYLKTLDEFKDAEDC